MALSFPWLDLGSLAREAGHPGLARDLLEQARVVAREMGECLHECHVALQIGDCHLALGQVDEAEAELKAARDIARKFGAATTLCGGWIAGSPRSAWCAKTTWVRASTPAGPRLRARNWELGHSWAQPCACWPPRSRGARRASRKRGGPREVFDRAVAVLGESRAEMELGRAFAAYAEYEERTGRAGSADDLRERARSIRKRAIRGEAASMAEPQA